MTRQRKRSASVVELTAGQKLALDQLHEIASYSAGELQIVQIIEPAEEGVSVCVILSVRARAFRAATGLKFRDRETFRLIIHPNFPFRIPELEFTHRRFVGAPHVQWGYHICLYISLETEWSPSDGMFGFVERFSSWLEAAGKGELDPDDAPLHPPTAYVGAKTHFVFQANAPEFDHGAKLWLGRAVLKQSKEWRFDVIDWRPLQKNEHEGEAERFAATLLLSEPFPFEYPVKVWDLINALEVNGLSFGLIITLFEYVALSAAEGDPGYIILGAPMRRPEPNGPMLQHLTAWEIEADAIKTLRSFALKAGEKGEVRDALIKWMAEASVRWCYFHENRSEVTNRRDTGSPASNLRSKRVLLFGCGAIGSQIAHSLIRAGAATLHLVDKGTVNPGLLVRQNYCDADIGMWKTSRLEAHLGAIGSDCVLSSENVDITSRGLAAFDPDQFDLIIDATASRRVSHRLEQDLREKLIGAPLLTFSIDASAEFGSVFVRMPKFAGGPIRLSREAKMKAVEHNRHYPVISAFWPTEQQEIFLPEPGCSDPTFVGSHADVAALSASMLNLGLRRLQELDDTQSGAELFAGPWNRHGGQSISLTLDSPAIIRDERHSFEVAFSDKAQAGIAAEISRIARDKDSTVETGGLIFGEIDEMHQHVLVDSVSGPPPDSVASADKFLCGTSGTAELNRLKAFTTLGSSKFIGIWHTHPISSGNPSNDDFDAMVQLLHLEEAPPRYILMIIIEFAATQPNPRCYVFHRNDFLKIDIEQFVQMMERGDE